MIKIPLGGFSRYRKKLIIKSGVRHLLYKRHQRSRKKAKKPADASSNMHEVSLIRTIFSTLEATYTPEELDKLKTVHLKLGKLSNVEPVLMTSALHAVSEAEEKFQNLSLEMEVIPVKIFCEECGEHSFIENYTFICHHCGKPNNTIVEGEELLISKVEFH